MPLPVLVTHSPIQADSANRANPSVVLPTIAANDVVLVYVGYGAASTTLAANLGFTQMRSRSFSTLNTLELWGKKCDGSESGLTLTFTTTLSRAYTIDVLKISGGAGIAVLPSNSNANTTNTTSHNGAAVTTITPNALLIQGIRCGNAAADPMTQPTGWTLRDQGHNAGGTNPGTLATATAPLVAAGTSDTNPWTSNSSINSVQITVAVLDGSADAAPTANAGPDQLVLPSAVVPLTGAGSDPDNAIASYQWACVNAYGPGASTSDPILSGGGAVQNPMATMPNKDGCVYIFSLVVTDTVGTPSTNVAHTAVFLDKTMADGIFPFIAGVWNQTGVLLVLRAETGTWDVVNI